MRVAAMVLAGLALATSPAAAQSLAGAWSASVGAGTPTELYMQMSLSPDGRIRNEVRNTARWGAAAGMGYTLIGVYQADLQRGTFTYRWTDYAPRQTCMPGTGCLPLAPPAPMGVTRTDRIRVLNLNEFIASAADGSTTWIRVG